MAKDMGLPARFDAFCNEYDIPEKHHGSLGMLASMAFVLGLEIQISFPPRPEQERMNDEYGRIHTDGSRSGGQPLTDILERLRTKYCCTTENCNCEEAAAEIETLRHDLERQMTIANEHVNEAERLREALAHIAFSGADGPYGHFGEAVNEYQMRSVAKAALQEQSK